jgi:VanZ family protein
MFLRSPAARAWLFVLAWMTAIFIGSTDLLSSGHTSRFIGPMLRWIWPHISQEHVDQIQYLIRKCGHLSEYAVLAVLAWRALHLSTESPRAYLDWRNLLTALALAAAYAATDEFHQHFVATRYASPLDVLIDSVGAAAGLGLATMGVRFRELRRNG